MGLFSRNSDPRNTSEVLFTRYVQFGDSGYGMTVKRIRNAAGDQEWQWRFDPGLDPYGIGNEYSMNIGINLLDLEYGFPITWPLYEDEARKIFGERPEDPITLMVKDAIEGRLDLNLVRQRLIERGKPIAAEDLEMFDIYGLGSSLVEFRGETADSLLYMPAEEEHLEDQGAPERSVPTSHAVFLELPCNQDLLWTLFSEISDSHDPNRKFS